MKDITLVHISMSHPRTVPSGTLYIAAVLDRAGYKVDVRDYPVDSYEDLEPVRVLSCLEGCADVIGVSCMSDSLPFVVCAMRELKRKYPGKKIIMGGAGPTGVARELLCSFPFIDIVVVGEGEETILEVMERLTGGEGSDLGEVKGICYRHDGEVMDTPPRERISDLDQLPFPLYESIPMERYPLVNIVFSRGCPYRCTFCDVAPMWNRRNYRRSVDSVMDELGYLKERYGKTDFEFADETFVLNQDVVLDFCRRLRKEKLGVGWAGTARINLVTPDLLSEMASSGCKAVFYGIESGSDRILEKVRKDFSIREAVEVIRKTLDHMNAVASFIWGFPFETEEDFLKTLLLMVYMSQIGVDARLNRLVPFALTPLYEEFGDRLVWFEKNYSFSDLIPFQTPTYRKEVGDLVRNFPRVFPEFYWFPADRLDERHKLVESLGNHWHGVDWPLCCESGV